MGSCSAIASREQPQSVRAEKHHTFKVAVAYASAYVTTLDSWTLTHWKYFRGLAVTGSFRACHECQVYGVSSSLLSFLVKKKDNSQKNNETRVWFGALDMWIKNLFRSCCYAFARQKVMRLVLTQRAAAQENANKVQGN